MSSSLALRSLFKALVARDGLTTRGPGLHGLTLQAKALAAAAASHEQPGDPVLVIVPSDAELDGVVGDVRFFLGAIEGLSDGALGGLVLPLPSLQVDPYRALAPHMRVSSARARALLALATGNARRVRRCRRCSLQRRRRHDDDAGVAGGKREQGAGAS